MKKQNIVLIIGLIAGVIIAPILYHFDKPVEAATITRGITFGVTDLVTNTKLHQLVDNATVSAIGTSDLSDLAVSNGKLAANAVTTDKVLDGTLLGTDLLDRTLTVNLYATNSVDGIGLSSNIVHRSGFLYFTNANTTVAFNGPSTTLTFSNDQISSSYVSGKTTSAGAADSGKVVKLNASGLVDSTMISSPFSAQFISTGHVISAAVSLPIPHTLGSTPTLVLACLSNISANVNYSAGDVAIIALGGLDAAGNYGIACTPDASNLNVRFGGAYGLPDKTTGTISTIDLAKWLLILRAWK